jgi:hypothetical protein
MRLVAIGCEYSGVTTLLDGVLAWANERGHRYHLDDHFSIPDRYHLNKDEQQGMVDLLPTLKERFQRMQVVYHIRLLHRYDNILLGGFHIEEEIYGPLYYYPGRTVGETRKYETEMPEETILVHLKASPEVIRSRMKSEPHEYEVIKDEQVEMLLERFAEQFVESHLKRKLEIDTSNLTPDRLLKTFFQEILPCLSTRDLLLTIGEKIGLKS